MEKKTLTYSAIIIFVLAGLYIMFGSGGGSFFSSGGQYDLYITDKMGIIDGLNISVLQAEEILGKNISFGKLVDNIATGKWETQPNGDIIFKGIIKNIDISKLNENFRGTASVIINKELTVQINKLKDDTYNIKGFSMNSEIDIDTFYLLNIVLNPNNTKLWQERFIKNYTN